MGTRGSGRGSLHPKGNSTVLDKIRHFSNPIFDLFPDPMRVLKFFLAPPSVQRWAFSLPPRNPYE